MFLDMVISHNISAENPSRTTNRATEVQRREMTHVQLCAELAGRNTTENGVSWLPMPFFHHYIGSAYFEEPLVHPTLSTYSLLAIESASA